MADSNNHRVAELPLTPHPAMTRLRHLVGTWKNEGAVPGTSVYRMGLGGHYLIQRSRNDKRVDSSPCAKPGIARRLTIQASMARE